MSRESGSLARHVGRYALLGLLLPSLLTGSFLGAGAASADAASHREACGSGDLGRNAPGRVELDPTRAGVGFEGWVELTFARSPYGVTVSADGRYVYDLVLRVRSQRTVDGRTLVAWATTRELDQVQKLGVLHGDTAVTGQVEWNKFLVFVTAEVSADVETWEGPILLTGMSPSGRMHTMAGHGIFEAHGIGC